MKTLAALLWLFLSQAALAQTVVVKSGDHPGFTRLVLELPGPVDWQMGRSDDGYNLRIDLPDLRYDLSQVFQTIDKTRLAAIWRDPQTGNLHLGIGCACHALPFEFRPGILVVDLRDGPPPAGSSFELALDGGTAGKLVVPETPRPRARPGTAKAPQPVLVQNGAGYDWLATARPQKQPLPASEPAVAVEARIDPVLPDHDIAPLKDALFMQLSRGAAQGVIQMQQPDLAMRNVPKPGPVGPRANLRLAISPGFVVPKSPGQSQDLIEAGESCIEDDRLQIGTWGDDQPVAAQLATARTGMIGEFDKPDAQSVIRNIRLHLHLGFGAEASQLMAQFPVEHEDFALWASLAKLVDGAPDAASPFAGMQTCDNAAALWSVLANPSPDPANPPNKQAVLRSFSALPAHLRRSIGPVLAAGFLSMGDVSTARSISAAIARSPDPTGPDVAVMDAEIELASGNPEGAAERLDPVLAEAGPATAEALLTLVDAHLATQEALDQETAVALAALVREYAGAELEPALQRAQILALALAGDFDQAFALLPQRPETETELWGLLARTGQASAILTHAVKDRHATLPMLDQDVKSELARHLLALGLPEAALIWVKQGSKALPEADRLLIAEAQLRGSKPEAALATLSGLEGAEAAGVRARALGLLGRDADAAAAWAAAGDTASSIRATGWARDWQGLQSVPDGPWKPAADLVSNVSAPAPAEALGPLARGAALVEDSAKTRETLAAFLQAIPKPAP